MEKQTKTEEKTTKKVEKNQYIYTVGRRKSSTARVKLFKNGSGKITINGKDGKDFFPALQMEKIDYVFRLIGQENKLDVDVKVLGGGITGQAEAIANGISRALIELNINFRKPLKKAKLLRRDARKKERKKPGLKRARRAPQWQKR